MNDTLEFDRALDAKLARLREREAAGELAAAPATFAGIDAARASYAEGGPMALRAGPTNFTAPSAEEVEKFRSAMPKPIQAELVDGSPLENVRMLLDWAETGRKASHVHIAVSDLLALLGMIPEESK